MYIYIYGGSKVARFLLALIFVCYALLCYALLSFAEHASESLDPSMCLFLRGILDNMLVILFIMG